jgi:hypothetical protein
MLSPTALGQGMFHHAQQIQEDDDEVEGKQEILQILPNNSGAIFSNRQQRLEKI